MLRRGGPRRDAISVHHTTERDDVVPTTTTTTTTTRTSCTIEVDVIVPVYNAASTLRDAIMSVMSQHTIDSTDDEHRQHPDSSEYGCWNLLDIHVCCYDDGSTDESWNVLQSLRQELLEDGVIEITPVELSEENNKKKTESEDKDDLERKDKEIRFYLHISKSSDGISRGAGYARNRAVEMRAKGSGNTTAKNHHFLCWLDSDDVMHPNRIVEQVATLMSIRDDDDRRRTLVGCNIVRDPPDSTWHYAMWANDVMNGRRFYLERYREVTLLQPTWMMSRSWFLRELGNGYIEAPLIRSEEQQSEQQHHAGKDESSTSYSTFSMADFVEKDASSHPGVLRLIHPEFETPRTLRVAEDLRLFHAHMSAGGLLKKVETNIPLVTYRHRAGSCQSSQTPRKLLLQLRARAFEWTVLDRGTWRDRDFVVWGAGRDGRDFVKALTPSARKRVRCMVDVDENKISTGYYVNRNLNNGDDDEQQQQLRIPIVHFSMLIRDEDVREKVQYLYENDVRGDDLVHFGKIDKSSKSSSHPQENDHGTGKSASSTDNVKRGSGIDNEIGSQHSGPPAKKNCRRKNKLHNLRKDDDVDRLANVLPTLPVVVCVAMYRTGGALENNVNLIGRTEGEDLWHFS